MYWPEPGLYVSDTNDWAHARRCRPDQGFYNGFHVLKLTLFNGLLGDQLCTYQVSETCRIIQDSQSVWKEYPCARGWRMEEDKKDRCACVLRGESPQQLNFISWLFIRFQAKQQTCVGRQCPYHRQPPQRTMERQRCSLSQPLQGHHDSGICTSNFHGSLNSYHLDRHVRHRTRR
jgi:hypothetical protein